jgi:hypothetical protein
MERLFLLRSLKLLSALARRPRPSVIASEIEGRLHDRRKLKRQTACRDGADHLCQWPKINQRIMITGIGTPSNQSRSPRPMVSSITCPITWNAKRDIGFLCKQFRCTLCRWGAESADRNTPTFSLRNPLFHLRLFADGRLITTRVLCVRMAPAEDSPESVLARILFARRGGRCLSCCQCPNRFGSATEDRLV